MTAQTLERDLHGRLMADTDPELFAFLKSQVNTFIKWDLIRFFHENPHTNDTADNIARYAGRDATAIAVELADLTESGVLSVHTIGGLPVYSLTDDEHARGLIARFVAACQDRQFRLRASYHIIRSKSA